ncbi:putative zinc finger protein [Trypanosoma rangeli]|uniref:Putative zinc finger protein n=1 Tax=Trypanosoma rangeli TaxID=5698 RepID=A0A3R7MLT6_TRYRA|nr:putative zinc finger protein [Trypanosoma rangeli]RNF04861.1 putative zinc finger protein [Trypanosoma rangeli]|eukprot:RNF04861.1 putative zinc finger protein [Trypanosoma rangeli]
MPLSYHGQSDSSSADLLKQGKSVSHLVEETALVDHLGFDSITCTGCVTPCCSIVFENDGEGEVHVKRETGVTNAHAYTDTVATAVSSTRETTLIMGEESLEEEFEAATQNHVRPSEDGNDKDDALRPASPFVVLCYGERGCKLTSSGTVDVSVIELETELENVRRKLTVVRMEEEKRRRKLYEAWMLEAQVQTAVPFSPPPTLREEESQSQNSASTDDDVVTSRTQFSDAASNVTYNVESIHKEIPTASSDVEEGVQEREVDAGKEPLVGRLSGGYEDEMVSLLSGKKSQIKRSARGVDSAEVGINCSSLRSENSLLVSSTVDRRLESASKAGKRWSRGKRAKKIKSTDVTATAKDDGAVAVGDEDSGEATCPATSEDSGGGKVRRDRDEEIVSARYSFRLMQTGSGGMVEFVFDDNDASKRIKFHEAETALMLAEQRILLQIETLQYNRLKTGKHYWQSNESASHCTRCGKLFSITVRRHHCRRCGILLCNDCCSQVGRDMYAPQSEVGGRLEEEDLLFVNENEASQNTADGERASIPRNEYEWMFDTYDLTYGTNWNPEGDDDDKTASQRSKVVASHAAQGSGCGRGGLKVRTAPWCRICNCCYLICLRARIEQNYSGVLSDGRRRFHVLRDDEQALTNMNMTWEARIAQLDVLRHLVVERTTSAAQGRIDHIANFFKEWVRSLGRGAEKPSIESDSGRSSCGSRSR